MRASILILFATLFCSFYCLSQDTLDYENIAESYYLIEDAKFIKEGKAYSSEYRNKNGHAPSWEDDAKFYTRYYKRKGDDLLNDIKIKSSCKESTISFIKKRLRIAEFRKVRNNDSTAYVLFSSLYELDSEIALSYTIDRWRYLRQPEYFTNDEDYESYLDSYPYVNMLFNNLSNSRFLQFLLLEKVDKDLVDICIRKFKIQFTLNELDEFDEYIESYIKINKIDTYNEYFVSRLKSIAN